MFFEATDPIVVAKQLPSDFGSQSPTSCRGPENKKLGVFDQDLMPTFVLVFGPQLQYLRKKAEGFSFQGCSFETLRVTCRHRILVAWKQCT